MIRGVQFCVFCLALTGLALVRVLSLTVLFRLGALAGRVAWVLAPKYRRLAIRNLTIAFGGEMDPSKIHQLAREHFQSLGGNLLCSPKLAMLPQECLTGVITVENEHVVDRAKQKGKGVIFVISHLGSWEVLSQISIVSPALSGGTIYQPFKNPFLDRYVQRLRERVGLVTFNRHDGFDGPIRHLREGGGLGVLVDQHAGDHGIWTPLFGRLASTSPLAAMLRARTGAALVPIAVFTTAPGRWRVVASPEIGENTRHIASNTLAINRCIEAQVRDSPADWFWVHNRWKTPRPQFLLERTRRGIHLPAGTVLKPFRIVIRSSNWLGDAIMSIPAVRAIKNGRPDAHVTILCHEKLADLWRIVPHVDDVLSIPRRAGVPQVAAMLRHGDFDAAILFPNSLRSALEVFLAGVPRRVGYAGHHRKFFLNQIIPPGEPARPPKHHIRQFLRLAEHLGADNLNPSVAIYPHEPDTNGPVKIGLCPGAEYGPAKRWPGGAFGRVVAEVAKRRDVEWLIFGVHSERKLAAEIEIHGEGRCRNLVGKTDLSELVAELSRCHALLTNDTGTMHLGTMLNVPVVALFGSTEPALTGPLGGRHRVIRHHVECSPCFLRECPIDFRCMKAIRVGEVVEAVLRCIDAPARRTVK